VLLTTGKVSSAYFARRGHTHRSIGITKLLSFTNLPPDFATFKECFAHIKLHCFAISQSQHIFFIGLIHLYPLINKCSCLYKPKPRNLSPGLLQAKSFLHIRFLCLYIHFVYAALLLGLINQVTLATLNIYKVNRSS
jgi:hypothetical protein